MKSFLIFLLAVIGLQSAYAGVCTNTTLLTSLGATQLDFMYGVVQGTFNVITADGSYLEPFFNGSVPANSTDFIDPDNTTSADEDLIKSLVAYFAPQDPFGCTDSDIPAYTNPKSLAQIHADMPINEAAFNTFNTAMLGVLEGMGVSQEDQDAVLNFLESTKSDICNECSSFGVSLTPAIALSFIAMLALVF